MTAANDQLDASWDRFVQHLRDAADVVRRDPRADDPQLRAQGYRYLLNLTNAALEQAVFSADPDFPEHGRLQDNTRRYSVESPDCLFGVTVLDPSGTYRLTGTGGTAHYIGFTLYRDMDMYGAVESAAPEDFRSVFAAATGSTLGALSSPGALTFADDGSFEVILSAEERPGNWLPLTEDVHHLISRQYFYDWDAEEPWHFTIERLDRPPGGPVATPSQVTQHLVDTGEQVEGMARFFAMLFDAKAAANRNVLVTQPPLQEGYAGNHGHIAYGGGYLEVADDEAVIVEFTPPACHFWNIQLGDLWAQSLDYTWRQTHLNGHQATLDSHGVFRGVIAHEDPGVANWLDTAGNRFLQVTYRWWLMESPDVVHPQVRFVKLADLEAELHPDTPRTAPDERAEVLARRRTAVLRRYRR